MHQPGRRKQKRIERLKAQEIKVNKGISKLVLVEKLKSQEDILVRLKDYFLSIDVQNHSKEGLIAFFENAIKNKKTEVGNAENGSFGSGKEVHNKNLQQDS